MTNAGRRPVGIVARSRRRDLAPSLVFALVLASSSASAAAGRTAMLAASDSLDFDRTFVTNHDGQRSPDRSYYAATYRLGGDEHRVEVWRDREMRVKRRTDDAVETYLVRPAGGIEWSMTVLDLRRHIRTDIDRTNLLRIGHFTDWFAQAHALSRPQGSYRLDALASGPAGVRTIAPCRWYRLSQSGRTTTLCWSAAQRVPLAIVASDETVVWRVTNLASGPFPSDPFTIDHRGYVRNDANADIRAD